MISDRNYGLTSCLVSMMDTLYQEIPKIKGYPGINPNRLEALLYDFVHVIKLSDKKDCPPDGSYMIQSGQWSLIKLPPRKTTEQLLEWLDAKLELCRFEYEARGRENAFNEVKQYLTSEE